jgi:hypothetical protein
VSPCNGCVECCDACANAVTAHAVPPRLCAEHAEGDVKQECKRCLVYIRRNASKATRRPKEAT